MQQRQRVAAQYRQQQQLQQLQQIQLQQIQQQHQQQKQQEWMRYQQYVMAMEQQKRAALSASAGGLMYSGSLPPPLSHEVATSYNV